MPDHPLIIETLTTAVDDELRTLLFAADPDHQMVASSLPGAEIFTARRDSTLLGVCLLQHHSDRVELKNLSVTPAFQRQGIATKLIAEAKRRTQACGATILEVGTGNASLQQLALYQRCGFRLHDIQHDYFARYQPPIIENGIPCRDLIRLRLSV